MCIKKIVNNEYWEIKKISYNDENSYAIINTHQGVGAISGCVEPTVMEENLGRNEAIEKLEEYSKKNNSHV